MGRQILRPGAGKGNKFMLSQVYRKIDLEQMFRKLNHRDFLKYVSIFTAFSIMTIVLITGGCIFLIYKNHIFQNAERNAMSIGTAIVGQERDTLFSREGLRDLSLDKDTKEMADFDRRMKKYLKPFQMVKIKIYNLDRKIIFSTDPKIIGSRDGKNKYLDRATAGEFASKLKTKAKVWDLDGEHKFDLDLVETYLPLKSGKGEIHGVFEIYAD